MGFSKVVAVNERICHKCKTYSDALEGIAGDFSEGRGRISGDWGTKRSRLVAGVSFCLVLAGAGVTISKLGYFSDNAHYIIRV